MMKSKISLSMLALAAMAACSPSPSPITPVQQLDASAVVWSTGSYR